MHVHGNACTRHDRIAANIRPDGRCRRCHAEAVRRHRQSCQAARHKLRQLESLLLAS
jgi:hypothetical protein